MKVRIGRKNFYLYALDIESHNDEESLAKRETSMWLGCFIDEKSKIDDESSYFYTWDDLFAKLERMTRITNSHNGRGHNLLIYVYNLAFEYSFILPYLLSHGWTWSYDPDKKKRFNATTTKTCTSVWDIHIVFDENHKQIEFRDIGKIYSGGIRNVAKSFGLETQKGEMDYTLNRLHGHIVTKEEKEYCFKDTKIVVEILQRNIARHDYTFFKCLSSSGYAVTKMIEEGYSKSYHPQREWRKDYPYINGDESEFLRKSVAGGLTQVLPDWQFKEINQKVCHIDANQMHPSSAYLHLYPYGTGEYGQGMPPLDDRIKCVHIKVSYTGVKIHSVIALIGISAIEDYELWVWSFEIPIMRQCYKNLEIEWIDYYAYKTKYLPWRKFYKENWDKRMIAKENGDSFEYMYRKLLNNGSYGKLIEKPHLIEWENVIDETGVANSIPHDRDINDDKDLYNAHFTYIPVGSCIPAYSRVCLIETALAIGWEKVTYTDTDSIFFIEDEESMKALKHLSFAEELGGWKIEEHIQRSQYAVPKRYKVETDEGETYVKAGGFNFDIEDMDFMSVDILSSEWEVKGSVRVKGGTIIDVKKKDITIPSKYRQIYEDNVIMIKEEVESAPYPSTSLEIDND